MTNNDKLLTWYKDNQLRLTNLSDEIFQFREIALEEHKSAAALKDFLASEGFSITAPVAGLDTAFVAKYGTKGPVISFLAEYDALPGLEQLPQPVRTENVSGMGHGCGHNLLGVGACASGAALKHLAEEDGVDVQIVVFGCPAEEILRGKIDLIEAGYFNDVDVAITWHPSTYNTVSEESNQAKEDLEITFLGRSSHAAISPHQGRSALDACELMNVGVNYLREHVTDDVRMHYVYKEAGVASNIVPDRAVLSYSVRAKDHTILADTIRRVELCAQGAATMTETQFKVEKINHCYDTLVNFTLNEAFQSAIKELPPISFTDEERHFARELSINAEGSAKEIILNESVVPKTGKVIHFPGSTDVANVSQLVPTTSIFTACSYNRAAPHNWAFTATCGMSIGHKGMLYASQIMTLGALNLAQTPSIIRDAKQELSKLK